MDSVKPQFPAVPAGWKLVPVDDLYDPAIAQSVEDKIAKTRAALTVEREA